MSSAPPPSEVSAAGARGRLYLVPAPLDFGCAEQSPLPHSLPDATLAVAARLRHWICENAKSTRAYLKRVQATHPLALPLQQIDLAELPHAVHKKGDHTGGFDARALLAPALRGEDIGLVSEAGMPAIADPGSSVVRAAHALEITVVPLVGPVSLLLALAASGLNGQDFAFVGYLPQEVTARARRLKELEALVLRQGQTQLFIETPYRNTALAQHLLQVLPADLRLAISSALGTPQSFTRSARIADWRRSGWMPSNQLPAVFALGR